MKLEARNIEASTTETTYYDDIGYTTIYKYDLYNNDKFIKHETISNKEPDFEELQNKYLIHIITTDLTNVITKLNDHLPDSEFTGHRICEDDFYENRTHDLRNPELTELDEARQYGREIFFKYLTFLKNHFDTLEKIY